MTAADRLWTPPAGTLGLDRSATIAAQAPSLSAMGYRFAVRTLGLDANTPGVLTAGEVEAIQSAGMAIGLYQSFSPDPGYVQSSGQGTTDGAFAAEQASALGAPPGLVLWYDLEVTYACSASTMVGYLNAWAAAVKSAGFAAGMYVGGQSLLSTAVISSLPDFHAYWMAACRIESPSGIARGFQMYQLLPYYTASPTTIMAAGINIDGDVVQADHRGDLPTFWAAS